MHELGNVQCLAPGRRAQVQHVLSGYGCKRRRSHTRRRLLHVEKTQPVLDGGRQPTRSVDELVKSAQPTDRLSREASGEKTVQKRGFRDPPFTDTKDGRLGTQSRFRKRTPVRDARAVPLEIDRPLARGLTPPAPRGQKPSSSRGSGSSSSRTSVRIAACGTTR